MTLLDEYRSLIAKGVIEADPGQAAAAASLDALGRALRGWRPRSRGLARFIVRPTPPPKGHYIFGPVGRGKTMLMDLFFETVRFAPKRRVHFHEFMAEVHERIGVARQTVTGDPLPHVARGLARKARLICFDELHVTDIADAMILGRLFKELFAEPVVVVATSNVPPNELYKNGLNRALFLPFIALIEQHMNLEELLAAKDFRLEKLVGRQLYFAPADLHAKAQLDRLWSELTGKHPGAPTELMVKGRRVRVPLASMGVARFAFGELCEQPLGASDFLHIAHTFHTLLIDGIPIFTPARREVTRRFVNLIDTLYDNRVCLIASAAAEPHALYPAGDMQTLFERTSSRLYEMRSQEYLTGRLDRIGRAASA
jgi:cell division protein ZapE